eukprot:gb/GECG01014683.1/.p1 GENE.gb/GECG01014683.1/~~gb/GECG01014683.1/.p1  ORF type:complete len:381 (+),score=43.30 gb/GECG01014683.1/:1-1143(+)
MYSCAIYTRLTPSWWGRATFLSVPRAFAQSTRGAKVHPSWSRRGMSAATQDSNPLEDILTSKILTKGPISMAEFMKYCLTHPQYGYYMNNEAIFGRSGDFITSPEISPLFGEMIGLWCIMLWEKIKTQSNHGTLNLVEIGPGQGKLAQDLLRISRLFSQFNNAIQMWFVDVSPTLQSQQKEMLNCRFDEENDTWRTETGVPVKWAESLKDVDSQEPHIILAHELFDALPTHQFELTQDGWRERLVNVSSNSDTSGAFETVLSPTVTTLGNALFPPKTRQADQPDTDKSNAAESELLEELQAVSGREGEQFPSYVKVVSSDEPVDVNTQSEDNGVDKNSAETSELVMTDHDDVHESVKYVAQMLKSVTGEDINHGTSISVY